MRDPATWKTYAVLSEDSGKVTGGCLVREHSNISIGLKRKDEIVAELYLVGFHTETKETENKLTLAIKS